MSLILLNLSSKRTHAHVPELSRAAVLVSYIVLVAPGNSLTIENPDKISVNVKAPPADTLLNLPALILLELLSSVSNLSNIGPSVEITTLVTNIKLAQYLNSVPQRNIGEMILLINLIHGKNSSSMLDQYSLFLILESLNKLDPIYLDNFIFEYFVNNPI